MSVAMVAVGATVVGGVMSANAASDAADAQTAAANKSIALNEPFRQMGLSAGNRLMTLLGMTSPAGSDGTPGAGDPNDPSFGSAMKDFTPADFAAGQDPGYQFRLDQGDQALQNSAAARGGLLSGRAMKDAMAYNGGQASQEYQAAFNRFQTNRANKLNPLQSLMGVGQTANGAISSDITGAGNARAAGIVGGANAVNNAIGQGTSQYQNNVLMNRLFPTPTPRASVGTGLDPSMYAG